MRGILNSSRVRAVSSSLLTLSFHVSLSLSLFFFFSLSPSTPGHGCVSQQHAHRVVVPTLAYLTAEGNLLAAEGAV